MVIVERHDPMTGWAVFGGCEGEDPSFIAFFADKAVAEAYIAEAQKDSDADLYICDPARVPAATTGELLVANHYHDAEGAEAVIKESGLTDFYAAKLRLEAAGG